LSFGIESFAFTSVLQSLLSMVGAHRPFPADIAGYITAEAPKWAALVKLSGASIQ
jgi:hypothetical protein